MSYLTQMAGLAVQNFVSAAVGLCVAVALIRGLARRRSATIGNFWVDLVRGVRRGSCSRCAVVIGARPREPGRHPDPRAGPRPPPPSSRRPSPSPAGPFASQEAIKELGTNGGGTLNANSAHPFENPNGFTNLLQMGASCSSRSPSPTPTGGWSRTRSRAGSCSAPCSCSGPARSPSRPGFEVGRQPVRRRPRRERHPGGDRPAGRRQHGGQGGPLRPGRLRAVRRHHHRHLDRRGHRRPRQLHPAGRGRPAREHDAGRGQPGRGGRRPLRHARSSPCWRCSSPGSWWAAHRSTSARRSRPPR